MADIPILPTFGVESIAGRGERVLHPTKVLVRSEPRVPTLCLDIEVNGYSHVYPLSLPTATLLAKELRQAVRQYLNGAEPETE